QFYWYGTNGGWDGNSVTTGDFSNPFSGSNGYVGYVNDGSGKFWMVTIGCDSAGRGGCWQYVEYRILGGKVTLNDPTAPALSGISGSLSTKTALHGAEQITLNATDGGAGVYRIRALLDGAAVSSQIVNSNGGRCADVNTGNANPYE